MSIKTLMCLLMRCQSLPSVLPRSQRAQAAACVAAAASTKSPNSSNDHPSEDDASGSDMALKLEQSMDEFEELPMEHDGAMEGNHRRRSKGAAAAAAAAV